MDDPQLDIVTIRAGPTRPGETAKRSKPGSVNVCAFYTNDRRSRMLQEKEIENRMEAALAAGSSRSTSAQGGAALEQRGRGGGAGALAGPDPGLLPPSEFIRSSSRTASS